MLDPSTLMPFSHRDELLKAAERDRLAAQAAFGTPRWTDRVLLAAGSALISTGLKMYAWYQLRRLRRNWAGIDSAF